MPATLVLSICLHPATCHEEDECLHPRAARLHLNGMLLMQSCEKCENVLRVFWDGKAKLSPVTADSSEKGALW